NWNRRREVGGGGVREVPAAFEARRSALRRRYRYSVLQQPTRPALARARVWWIREPLAADAMTAASLHWLGEHDFSAFRAAGCQAKSPMRRMMAIRIARAAQSGGGLWQLRFTAHAFLPQIVSYLLRPPVRIRRRRL